MDSVASSASRKRPVVGVSTRHQRVRRTLSRCEICTWYYVRQGAQRRLKLRDLARVLGDKVVVHGQPLGRQREGVAQVGQGRRPFGLCVCICRCRHDGQTVDQVMKNGEEIEVSSRGYDGEGVVGQSGHRSIALEVEERVIDCDVVSSDAR